MLEFFILSCSDYKNWTFQARITWGMASFSYFVSMSTPFVCGRKQTYQGSVPWCENVWVFLHVRITCRVRTSLVNYPILSNQVQHRSVCVSSCILRWNGPEFLLDGFFVLKAWKAVVDIQTLLTLIHQWSISHLPSGSLPSQISINPAQVTTVSGLMHFLLQGFKMASGG